MTWPLARPVPWAGDGLRNSSAHHSRSRQVPAVRSCIHAHLIKHGGRLLAADEHPEVTKGQWDSDKIVLMAFPDRETLTTWATSPEYREISEDRLAAAETTGILVRGLT